METKDKKEFEKSLKLVAKSSLIVFVGIFLSKIFSYAYRIIIARNMGPEVYGLFSLATMVLALTVSLFSLGLHDGITRYIPIYRGKRQSKRIKHVFKSTAKILLITSILSGIALFFLSDIISIKIFHNSELIIFLKVFSFLVPFSIFASFFLSTIRAFEKISWFSFIFNILQSGVKLGVLILLVFIGLKSQAIIWSYFAGIASMFFVAYLVTKYKIPDVWGKYQLSNKKAVMKDLFSYSWPLMLWGVLLVSLHWIDSFAIGYFLDVESVGFYNAAVPIALLLGFAPQLFMKLFFPLVTKEFARNKLGVVRDLTKQVGKWIFIINIPAFLLMIFFPDVLINILFGPEYIAAENSLRFLAIGTLFSSVFVISQNLISTIGKSKLILLDTLIILSINIVLDIILVPRYGINGAAFATMIAGVFLSLLFLYQARKHLSAVPLKKSMIKIGLISVIPLLLLFYLNSLLPSNLISWVLQILFFGLLYLLLVFFLGGFDKSDIMIFKSIKKKVF